MDFSKVIDATKFNTLLNDWFCALFSSGTVTCNGQTVGMGWLFPIVVFIFAIYLAFELIKVVKGILAFVQGSTKKLPSVAMVGNIEPAADDEGDADDVSASGLDVAAEMAAIRSWGDDVT